MASVHVKTLAYGVEISQVGGKEDRQIFLGKEAWQSLCDCRAKFHKALRDGKDLQVTLDEKKDLRAHTNQYQGKTYLHIRNWWKGHPTKTGVSLLADAYDQLLLHLEPSDEVKLGVEVMKKMLEKGVRDIMEDECEGCVKAWPSQRDHACMMEAEFMSEKALNAFVDNLEAPLFISRLAKEALKEGLILEAPHETLKRIHLFYLSDLKKEVLSSYRTL